MTDQLFVWLALSLGRNRAARWVGNMAFPTSWEKNLIVKAQSIIIAYWLRCN